MKNKLAENMLRFGTKNLTESQLENIQETELNEAPGDWSKFDQQRLQKMVDQINQAIDKRNAPAKQKNPNIDSRALPIPVKLDLYVNAPSVDIGGAMDIRPIYKISAKTIGAGGNGVIGTFDTARFFERGSNENDNRPEDWGTWKRPWEQLLNSTNIASVLSYGQDGKIGRMASNYKRSGNANKAYKAMADVLVDVMSPYVTPAYDAWYAQRSKATDIQSPKS
jgi:hypothetical protein|tara:strand:- start:565 stop:1233 length:669 start_codon:yes stop_codon:yes gene_type:complete